MVDRAEVFGRLFAGAGAGYNIQYRINQTKPSLGDGPDPTKSPTAEPITPSGTDYTDTKTPSWATITTTSAPMPV